MSAEQKDQALGRRMSSPWLSQESHPVDGLTSSGASGFGFPTNAVPGSTGVLGQQRFQSLKAGSPFGQSSLRQCPPSPTLITSHPHVQLPSLTEQNRPKAQSLSHLDPRRSQFSGKSNVGVHNPYNPDSLPISTSHVRPGMLAKSQAHDPLASSPSIPSFQPRHQYPFAHQLEDSTEPEALDHISKMPLSQVSNAGTPSTTGSSTPDHPSSLTVETLGDSNTSNLLAAVMKSGILSKASITTSSISNLNFQDLGQLPSSLSGLLPSIPSGPTPKQFANPGSTVASASSLGHSSFDNSLVHSKTSQKKVEQPPLPSGLLPSSSPNGGVSENALNVVNKVSDPISNLLSSLVAKGLLSASKTESPIVVPPKIDTEMKNKIPRITSTSSEQVSSVSVSAVTSTRKDSSFTERASSDPTPLPQPTKFEMKNLIGFDFKPDVIREFHSSVISELFDGFTHQCEMCGLTFKVQEQLSRHLEWHDLKKPEAHDSIKASRKWYGSSIDWVSATAGLPLGLESAESVDKPKKMVEKDEPMVPEDESQCVCVLCGEIFEDFYCEERDEWMFKGTKYLTIPSGTVKLGIGDESAFKGPIVHVNCVSDSSLHDLGLVSNVKMVMHS